MFTNLCSVLLLLLAVSLVSKFPFQLTIKKAREESRKRSDIIQLGKWRESSALCFVL